MISEEKRSKSESYTQLPHLPEKTVPYSVYANTLEKLDLVEDQKSKLQQKVDEQKNEIMQICLREKELQYQIREQNLHHQMEQLKTSSTKEVQADFSRLSEGNNMSLDAGLGGVDATTYNELLQRFNQQTKELESTLEQVETWKQAYQQLQAKHTTLEQQLDESNRKLKTQFETELTRQSNEDQSPIHNHNNSTMQMIQLSPASRDNSEESEDACEILATEDREESQSEEIKRNSQAS